MKKRLGGIMVLALVAGCAGSDGNDAAGGGSAGTPAGGAGAAAQQPPPTPRAPAPPSPAANWRVSPTGIGSIRAEMGIGQAARELGSELRVPTATERCAIVPAGAGLDSVSFMVVNGRIARVDVTGGRTTTVEGARVGDTEARINELYAGRVEVQPHKYTSGRYLVVRPMDSAESGYRIVFETDGNRVTRYRSGRLPEVGWVEGCS